MCGDESREKETKKAKLKRRIGTKTSSQKRYF